MGSIDEAMSIWPPTSAFTSDRLPGTDDL